MADKTANDFFDYDLKAAKPVQRYAGDLRTVIDTVQQGSVVGKIYSWVQDSSGTVWWELYETWKPGFNMWVKHDPNALLPVPPSNSTIQVSTPGLLEDFANAASAASKNVLLPIAIAIAALAFLLRKK